MDRRTPAAHWRRSSYCAGGGNNCVEIARLGEDAVAVRDSAAPSRALRVGAPAFASFLGALRRPRSSGGR
ncbi:DUF397 domain-containing protein [Streptomyces sp. C10-9-1]|uniref:DUF397 domain-containing protein n=1 Tax=Streptomyces sp. C10-9-1 TaxID=1859285 RepID=UPI00211179B6|nr:DUF397 domain-containing protein [Streptomyces sp. C10-9-1]MCQ6552681.1 DUF397 domain-containing protein [Streptomyces sp. C10-9-1]